MSRAVTSVTVTQPRHKPCHFEIYCSIPTEQVRLPASRFTLVVHVTGSFGTILARFPRKPTILLNLVSILRAALYLLDSSDCHLLTPLERIVTVRGWILPSARTIRFHQLITASGLLQELLTGIAHSSLHPKSSATVIRGQSCLLFHRLFPRLTLCAMVKTTELPASDFPAAVDTVQCTIATFVGVCPGLTVNVTDPYHAHTLRSSSLQFRQRWQTCNENTQRPSVRVPCIDIHKEY